MPVLAPVTTGAVGGGGGGGGGVGFSGGGGGGAGGGAGGGLRGPAPLAGPDFLPGRGWPRAETGHTGNTGFRQRAGERQNACAMGDCAMKDCASRQAQPFRLL